jgi:hypothetical protein
MVVLKALPKERYVPVPTTLGRGKMRRLLVGGVVAVVSVAAGFVGMAGAASAAPSNAPSSLTFVPTVCTSLTGGAPIVTMFVVNGSGRGPGISPVGVFQPLSLAVTVNGEPDSDTSFVKQQADRKSEYRCSGSATIVTPDGPATIAFIALGQFKP